MEIIPPKRKNTPLTFNPTTSSSSALMGSLPCSYIARLWDNLFDKAIIKCLQEESGEDGTKSNPTVLSKAIAKLAKEKANKM